MKVYLRIVAIMLILGMFALGGCDNTGDSEEIGNGGNGNNDTVLT